MNEGEQLRKAADEIADDALDDAIGFAFGKTAMHPLPEDALGRTIGRYKILEQIGEGGFGVVYMAEQHEPIRRRVALKVIKLGMDTKQVVARFEAERQALAMMNHENIAAVLDAGATETGRPYFVMELVRGVPITEYCDRNKLTTQQRLQLFIQVCKAVQHAHQKGIIHRDLKPNNVMVTHRDGEPIPKVIDFGVAKATQARLTEKTVFTRYGQFIGTPAYMSPEQVEMSEFDVDTRSDIFSLGVLLYELLTGSTPIEQEQLRWAAYSDMQRLICEEEPPKPSTRLSQSGQTLATISARRSVEPKRLGQIVRGELDWIVMKSLEKDRSRRFQTAGELAADVHRYLDDEPVTAGPPSAAYKLQKFIRRNKKLLGTVAAFAVLLMLGSVFSVWLAIRAFDAEQDAEEERDSVSQVRDELLDERNRFVESERRRQIERIEALITSSTESVSMLVKDLCRSCETVRPLIQRKFKEETRFENRVRLSVALTLLGDPQLRFLTKAVPQTRPAECANLLRAFRSRREESVSILRSHFKAAKTDGARFRYAVLLLELGEADAATLLLALKRDPSDRTRFIHRFRDWHGDLAAMPGVLHERRDSALRSGLVLAVGRLDPTTIADDVRQSIQKEILELFQTAPDGGVHSAAGWTLRQWRVALPAIEIEGPQAGRRWFVGAGGQTMIVLGANGETPSAGRGRFPWVFAISDRETPLALFRRFLNDADCPADQKPKDWPGVDKALIPSDECPVHNVHLVDVILFCNWLSSKERRNPCYEQDANGRWWCRFDRNGYRLPTADEWDHACYGGVTSRFPFGNDEFLLPQYGNLLLRRSQPGARLLPNAAGIFDALGNLWDMSDSITVMQVSANARQACHLRPFALKGATFGTGSYFLNRYTPFKKANMQRSTDIGFRVVCCDRPPVEPGKPLSPRAVMAWLNDRIAINPDSEFERLQRATQHARFRRWRDALVDFRDLNRLVPKSETYWTTCGLLYAHQREAARFQQIRAAMLKQFTKTNAPMVAERVCKTCLLQPADEMTLKTIEKLSKTAFSRPKPAWATPYIQVLRGLLDYRKGRFDEAIRVLEQNRPRIKRHDHYLRELNLAVLGLAYLAAGRKRDAMKAHGQIKPTLDAALADTSGRGVGYWQNLLTARVMGRELESLLQPSSKNSN